MKRGSRNGKKRYFCKDCNKSFSVNHREREKVLWISHVDGLSFRSIADEEKMKLGTVFNRVKKEMSLLPENTWLSQTYCSRWSGILTVDGKFVKVDGYKKKIPFVYAIDYLTHDIVAGVLVPSENKNAYEKLFGLLKRCFYPLQIVVCDDVLSALEPALFYFYPKALIQLCQNHYKENIRRRLHVRTELKHQHFFNSMNKHIFKNYQNEQQLLAALRYVYERHAKDNPTRTQILLDIHKRKKELFQYMKIPHCPKTTNLSELYNSHLNSRLNSIKGFQSFTDANRWLNAWMLRRRTKPLTDCKDKFKHLNGHPPIFYSLKKLQLLTEVLKLMFPLI